MVAQKKAMARTANRLLYNGACARVAVCSAQETCRISGEATVLDSSQPAEGFGSRFEARAAEWVFAGHGSHHR